MELFDQEITIRRTKVTKYLGLKVDKTLNWNDQIKMLKSQHNPIVDSFYLNCQGVTSTIFHWSSFLFSIFASF